MNPAMAQTMSPAIMAIARIVQLSISSWLIVHLLSLKGQDVPSFLCFWSTYIITDVACKGKEGTMVSIR